MLGKVYYNFDNIHKWSVSNSQEFWYSFWDFTKINGVKNKKKIKKSKILYKNIFLPKAKLNFGENLLSKKIMKKL